MSHKNNNVEIKKLIDSFITNKNNLIKINSGYASELKKYCDDKNFINNNFSKIVEYFKLIQKNMMYQINNTSDVIKSTLFIKPKTIHGTNKKNDELKISRDKNIASRIINYVGKNIFTSDKKILDIGCSKGGILLQLSKLTKNSNIYGADVIEKDKSILIKNYEQITFGRNLPYKKNTFDIVICSMSLHHIEELFAMLTNINIIIKDKGYLIIREHNIDNNTQTPEKMYQLIMHLFYNMLTGETYDYIKTYTMQDWEKIMTHFKFEKNKNEYLHVNNPNKEFIVVYQKNGDLLPL